MYSKLTEREALREMERLKTELEGLEDTGSQIQKCREIEAALAALQKRLADLRKGSG